MRGILILLLSSGLLACTRSPSPAPVQAAPPPPAAAPPVAAAELAPAVADPLVNRIWVGSDVDQPLGAMLVFLADGSLLQDSCTETYRISRWQRAGDGLLTWQEDATTIRAEVPALDEGHLTLRVTAPSALRDLHYTASSAAYVCPEAPRP